MKRFDTLGTAVAMLKAEREHSTELEARIEVLRGNLRRADEREDELLRERAALMADNHRLRLEIAKLQRRLEHTT